MPFFFLLVGVLLIVVAVNGNATELGKLLQSDFEPGDGQTGFFLWFGVLLAIGAVGYLPGFRKLSGMFLLLIMLVILLNNSKTGGGFFANLQAAIKGQ
jgi:hypothetical protein